MQPKDALKILESKQVGLSTENISIYEALNRILVDDIISPCNIPTFNKSAMDGYACRMEDISSELTLIETINAGDKPAKSIGTNECARIMTGAVVPNGADCVFMQEDSRINEGGSVSCTNPKTKTNICYEGEDITAGDTVIKKGTKLQAHHLGILASLGITNIIVYSLPKVAVFTTGSELVEPEDKPESHQIRNSNSIVIRNMLSSLGINSTYLGITKDDKQSLVETFKKAEVSHDIIILTGGVSVGDKDYTPEILTELGYCIDIQNTNIQPGKPMIFASKENKACFGLSGNPVSSFIQFILYAKPFLNKDCSHKTTSGILKEKYSRKKDKRNAYTPVIVDSEGVHLIKFNGSAHLGAFHTANAIMEIPEGVKELEKGDMVSIISL